MKKIFFIVLTLIPFFAISQAIQKNNLEINVGTGLGIYGTSDNDTSNENGAAVAALLNISCQYAISNKFSIGLELDRNGFAHDKDSANKAHSLSALINGQFRLLNKEKTSIFINLSGGYSNFKFIDTQKDVWVAGGGFTIQPGIGFKHYFGKTIGFYIQSEYAIYNYKKLTDADGNVLKTGPFNDQKDYQIKLSGLNLKIGLDIKF